MFLKWRLLINCLKRREHIVFLIFFFDFWLGFFLIYFVHIIIKNKIKYATCLALYV